MIRALIVSALAVAGCVFVAASCVDLADDCTQTKTCPVPPPASSSNTCQGTCLPTPTGFFGGPYLVWMGESLPPIGLCVSPLAPYFDGTAPPSTPVCPACACSTPTGSCALPASLTASESTCPATGPSAAWDAPNGWDGSCAAGATIAAVESVTVTPLVMNESCTLQTTTDTKPPPPPPAPNAWQYVFACEDLDGPDLGGCSTGNVCQPALPVVAPSQLAFTWTYCVSLVDPAKACPPTTYPVRRDFGDGWTSAPTCTDCTCAPMGSSCTPSIVTVYADDECSDEVGSLDAQTSTSTCAPLLDASSLGSMAATASLYMPGECTAGGGALVGGSPTSADPMTFCCQE